MPHIFISYSKKETRSQAEALFQVLSQHPGTSAWMDNSLEAGQSWAWQIQREIDRADYVVVLLSPDVNRVETAIQRRSFVLNEVDYAQQDNKPILPVLVQRTRIPVQLAGIQYIDITNDPNGIHRIIDRIDRRFHLESDTIAVEYAEQNQHSIIASSSKDNSFLIRFLRWAVRLPPTSVAQQKWGRLTRILLPSIGFGLTTVLVINYYVQIRSTQGAPLVDLLLLGIGYAVCGGVGINLITGISKRASHTILFRVWFPLILSYVPWLIGFSVWVEFIDIENHSLPAQVWFRWVYVPTVWFIFSFVLAPVFTRNFVSRLFISTIGLIIAFGELFNVFYFVSDRFRPSVSLIIACAFILATTTHAADQLMPQPGQRSIVEMGLTLWERINS